MTGLHKVVHVWPSCTCVSLVCIFKFSCVSLPVPDAIDDKLFSEVGAGRKVVDTRPEDKKVANAAVGRPLSLVQAPLMMSCGGQCERSGWGGAECAVVRRWRLGKDWCTHACCTTCVSPHNPFSLLNPCLGARSEGCRDVSLNARWRHGDELHLRSCLVAGPG